MSEKRVARSHPRTKTIDEHLAETWEAMKMLLFLTAGILFIGFVEAL